MQSVMAMNLTDKPGQWNELEKLNLELGKGK